MDPMCFGGYFFFSIFVLSFDKFPSFASGLNLNVTIGCLTHWL